jgi:hypothetical protein
MGTLRAKRPRERLEAAPAAATAQLCPEPPCRTTQPAGSCRNCNHLADEDTHKGEGQPPELVVLDQLVKVEGQQLKGQAQVVAVQEEILARYRGRQGRGAGGRARMWACRGLRCWRPVKEHSSMAVQQHGMQLPG